MLSHLKSVEDFRGQVNINLKNIQMFPHTFSLGQRAESIYHSQLFNTENKIYGFNDAPIYYWCSCDIIFLLNFRSHLGSCTSVRVVLGSILSL